ncbi:restriction endonuclease subunit S [Escherichia coli]|uniref:restriction endonuclease subunit S n=1 Tax=Escherichia coli TaxID=562 RepID=UPI000F632239|nr:restriction endonuclease subunit S [Escherichia coli]KAA9281653.1 restriction endonuclease subunit S [Escherichia coli]MBB9728422.1 restriction endonuclease subunit S [Escherichia coli]QLY23012.1 restriction endonuclease subunit S [Escherichia coli]RRM48577.1 restriction endonuclease subunit S [Escherichia coli]HDW2405732.1 restriction endonuclease subunit S [Escherichia coli]
MAGLNKYQAYPEYRDSGVEWLGEIPSHWRISKPRYMFKFGKGLTITKDNLQDEGIPCINYGEIHSKYGFEVSPKFHPLKCVDEKYLKDNSDSSLLKGDIIFADTSEDVDGSGNFSQLISDNIVFAGYHTIIAKPLNRKNWRFYAYLLDCKELRTQVRHAVKGVKVFSITQAILRSLSIWLPTDDEQSKIVYFLDHETAKIDNLIEKQQLLIELLKEKRQAVISHAVTKGLKPDVPMKDSGVEWLGEVPMHWNICAIKHIVSTPITDGPHETPNFTDEGIPFISAEAVSSGVIDFTKKRAFISQKDHYRFSQKYAPQFNDIFIIKSGATTGVTAIVDTYDDFNIWSPLAAIRCNVLSAPYFVLNFMRSKQFQTAIELKWSFGTQQNIGMSIIENIHITRPPIHEALEIANYIQTNCSKLEKLIQIAINQIALMQERRTALISAAVTGKIDLRNWTAPIPKAETPTEASA